MATPFWILWNPTSYKPPTMKFTSFLEAEKVAKSMAAQYASDFYIMRCSALVEPVLTPTKTTVY